MHSFQICFNTSIGLSVDKFGRHCRTATIWAWQTMADQFLTRQIKKYGKNAENKKH